MCWICKAKHSSLINSEIIEFIYNLPHTLLRLGSLETGQYPNAVTSASQLWATGALCTIHYTTIFISLITVLHACLNNELKFLGRELTVMTECVCVCAHYVTCSAGMTFSWRWLFTELVKACGNTVTHLDLCPGFFCCCINIVTCHNTGIRFQFTCFCQMKYLQIFWFPGTMDTVSPPLDKDNTPVSPKPLSFTAELFCVMG